MNGHFSGWRAASWVVVFGSGLLSCGERAAVEKPLPAVGLLAEDPASLPTPPREMPDCVVVIEVVSSYLGAEQAPASVQRTRAQARARAETILRLARAPRGDFEELNKRFSDLGPTALVDRIAQASCRGQLHPALERAAFGMEVGQVSDEIESPQGFHVLKRYPNPIAQAAEILIAYTGAERYTPRKKRSPTEAARLAEEIRSRLLRAPDSFAQEAERFSDMPNHDRGGVFPLFQRGAQNPKLEEIVWALEIGQISEIKETPTGFHIVRRIAPRKLQVRSLWLQIKDSADFVDTPQFRSREETLRLAEALSDRLSTGKEDFAALAAAYSDAPERDHGGLEPPFGRGQKALPVERAAFALAPLEISPVIPDERGFYLIKRLW